MTITLYQFEISPFCDKVRRVMNVKGLNYETRDPSVSELGKFQKLAPTGKLPVIDHGEERIADSSNIVTFLEERYPNPPLIPADPRERALAHMLEDWADEAIYWIEVTMRLTWDGNVQHWVGKMTKDAPWILRKIMPGMVKNQYRKKVVAQGIGRLSKDALLGHVAGHVEALDGWLAGGDWLVGERLSIADIAVYVQMNCIRSTPEGAPIINGNSSVAAWMDRVDRATGAAA